MLSHWLIDNVLDWWTGWCFDFLTGRLSDYLIGLTFGWLIDEMILFLKLNEVRGPLPPPSITAETLKYQTNGAESWLADLVLLHIFKQSEMFRFTEVCEVKRRAFCSVTSFIEASFITMILAVGVLMLHYCERSLQHWHALLCPTILKEQFK